MVDARILRLALTAAVALPGWACGSPDLTWHEEDGHRWAELYPGRVGADGFSPVTGSRTGIHLANEVTDEEIAANRHFLNGSGVAAGDVNGDGRVDLYFARLRGPNALYLNRGGLVFEDVTEAAGVAHAGHASTGVVLADVDGDRDLDLLVASLAGGVSLYRNRGDGTFEAADEPQLASTAGRGSYTLALADVDGDGTLDLYVANYRERSVSDLYDVRELTWENTVDETRTGSGVRYRLKEEYEDFYTLLDRGDLGPERREVGERDQLFLGDGAGSFAEPDPTTRFRSFDGEPMSPPRDWGLAARFRDLNGDRRPDLYVSNDFWTPDRIWINEGGTFRQLDPLAIRNLSFSSMTVAFSDVDRDGATDIFVTEMLSPDHEERARHYRPTGPYPDLHLRVDGRPQYNRNSLYLNRGDLTFAEAACYAGVEATGWSWATQFLDVDLDGYEDLLVANGFSYDLQDMDTQLRMYEELAQGARASQGHLTDYPPLRQVNRAFRNLGDRTFEDVSRDWGFREADISQAVALADLDDDGDLDLAINRFNDEAILYENTGRAPRIAVRLLGRPPNTQAIGATVRLEGGPVPQTQEVTSGGAYLSGSDPLVVFAADPGNPDHTLVVTWPDGGRSTLAGVAANRIYEIRQPEGRPPSVRPEIEAGSPPAAGGAPSAVFADVSDRLSHVHHEDPFDDWWLQPFLPVGLSRQGPGLSWIDVDDDGDDELLVPSGRGGRLAVFENLGQGRFAAMDLGALTAVTAGDQTAVLGWPEAEGVSLVLGRANLEEGNVGAPAAVHYAVDAAGVGERDVVPDNLSTTGPMAAADYDGDGDVDLFLGGRFIPAQYPLAATSRFFRNEGGVLVPDEQNARLLREIGLVTGAVFTDYDLDGDPDLVVSREWASLALFQNQGGRFRDVSEDVGLATLRGWWNGVATGDFDGDGRPDIVATNWGLNSPYRPDPVHPLRMYYDDFNLDHRVDIIEAYYDSAAASYVPRRQLFAYRSVASALLRSIGSHGDWAGVTVPELLGGRAGAVGFMEVNELRHTVFLNRETGFSPRPLPPETQLSAAFAAAVADYDNDGREDVFLGQNLFYVRTDLPRLDGGRGVWLKGDGSGGFEPVPGQVSGVRVYGAQKGAALTDFDRDGRVDLAVAQNGAATRLFRNRSPRAGLRVRLAGPPSNRAGIGSRVQAVYRDGTRGPIREIQAGSGYWSQHGTVQVLGTDPERTVDRVEAVWFDGVRGSVAVVGDPEETGELVLRHPEAAPVPQ